MLQIFHFSKSDMIFAIVSPFLWKARKVAQLQCLSCEVRTVKFFPRLLNSDWSIQILARQPHAGLKQQITIS